MALVSVTVCVLIDDVGDCGRGADRAEASEDYENRIRPVADAKGIRFVEITLDNVRPPELVEMTTDMGETEDETEPELTVK